MRELRCYVNGYVISELHLTPFNKYEEKINPLSFTVSEGQGLYSIRDLNCFSTDLSSIATCFLRTRLEERNNK